MIETDPNVNRSGIAEHWLTQCYSVAQLSGVRRQVDKRKDVVSLWRLLDELARQLAMATRLWRRVPRMVRLTGARCLCCFVIQTGRMA